MKRKRIAQCIVRQFEQRVPLDVILDEHGFESVSDLGEWMCLAHYRWDVREHRYIYDREVQRSEFQFDERSTYQRLNERELLNELEEQLSSMRQLLQGAFPVKITTTLRQSVLTHCQQYGYNVDTFIEEAIAEKLEKEQL